MSIAAATDRGSSIVGNDVNILICSLNLYQDLQQVPPFLSLKLLAFEVQHKIREYSMFKIVPLLAQDK